MSSPSRKSSKGSSKKSRSRNPRSSKTAPKGRSSSSRAHTPRPPVPRRHSTLVKVAVIALVVAVVATFAAVFLPQVNDSSTPGLRTGPSPQEWATTFCNSLQEVSSSTQQLAKEIPTTGPVDSQVPVQSRQTLVVNLMNSTAAAAAAGAQNLKKIGPTSTTNAAQINQLFITLFDTTALTYTDASAIMRDATITDAASFNAAVTQARAKIDAQGQDTSLTTASKLDHNQELSKVLAKTKACTALQGPAQSGTATSIPGGSTPGPVPAPTAPTQVPSQP